MSGHSAEEINPGSTFSPSAEPDYLIGRSGRRSLVPFRSEIETNARNTHNFGQRLFLKAEITTEWRAKQNANRRYFSQFRKRTTVLANREFSQKAGAATRETPVSSTLREAQVAKNARKMRGSERRLCINRIITTLAGEGFEPPVRFPVQRFSRREPPCPCC